MMDCREALQILEFAARDGEDLRDGKDFPSEVYTDDERAAAEAHLATCTTCARTIQNRRQLDRTIAEVMQSVPIPRGAQQRLLAQLAELESANSDSNAGRPNAEAELSVDQVGADSPSEQGQNGQSHRRAGSSIRPASASQPPAPVSRRRFLKVLLPACAAGLIGFFGVVWFFTPRWTVSQVSDALAEIESLQDLGNFTGSTAPIDLPSQPGWERLQWEGGSTAKGLALAPSVIAVYGFDIPKGRRAAAVHGLIAVLPRNCVGRLPEADSLATAAPTSGYVSARIGESVCVAWQQGDVVCVCLIQGGPDSLSTLQNVLEQPSA
jgi:hypothetical protein